MEIIKNENNILKNTSKIDNPLLEELINSEELKVMYYYLDLNVRSINNGGCGIFALMFYKAIKPFFINSKIVVKDYSNSKFGYRIDKINSIMNNNPFDTNNKEGIVFPHILIDIDGFLFDGEINTLSYSLYDKEEIYAEMSIYGEITQEQLEFIIKHGRWNSDYCRTQNKLIENIITHTIKKFLWKKFLTQIPSQIFLNQKKQMNIDKYVCGRDVNWEKNMLINSNHYFLMK